jgi:hypothetical protein
MIETIPGSCLCGAVQFEIVPPVRFCVHCHCSLCRRAHGAPLVTWTGVDTDRLRITGGQESLTHFASTPGALRSFCAVCGSTLFFESERWPGEVHVAVANLNAPLDMKPEAHVFYSDHAEWFDLSADLPRLGGKSGVEPLG